MSRTLLCALGLAALTATGCGRPFGHPCGSDVECAVGWSCVAGFCEPAPARDAATDIGDAAADDGDAAADDAARDASVAPETPDRSSVWNYVFVTSEPIGVPFGSLEIADGICDVAAAKAGLPGRYRAWLSTTQVNAVDRLKGARGWILTDGRPFADTVADIVAGRIFNPPSADEYGRRHDEGTAVFTGTTPEGTFSGYNCSDWSTKEGDALAGYRDGTTGVWTERDHYSCVWLAPIYCFGIDKAATLTPTQAAGRLAWLSTGFFRVNTGVHGADTVCADEAAAAGLTGRYKALVSTSTVSAADRFFTTPIGTVWVRRDGIPLNPPGVDLFSMGAPVTPLNITLRGERVSWASVLVGSRRPREKATRDINCNDWSTVNPMAEVATGEAGRTTKFFDEEFTLPCYVSTGHVYCLEDE